MLIIAMQVQEILMRDLSLGLYQQTSANISWTKTSAHFMLTVWFYFMDLTVISALFHPVQFTSFRFDVINKKSNSNHAHQSRENQSDHGFSRTTTVDVVWKTKNNESESCIYFHHLLVFVCTLSLESQITLTKIF